MDDERGSGLLWAADIDTMDRQALEEFLNPQPGQFGQVIDFHDPENMTDERWEKVR